MGLLWTILLATAPSWACSCTNTATPCSHVGGSTVIFVAHVLTDSGEGWGHGPARVAIEEPLQNVPSGLREAEISTAAGTSCYFRLKAGERYVILTQGPSYSVAGCSSSFQLRGNEHILEALRNQVRGGPPRLVGTVLKSTGAYSHGAGLDGVSVIAEADGVRHETTTDGFGHYVITALNPGRYKIQISKNGYVSDSTYNQRWSGRMSLNPATNRYEPDTADSGSVLVSERSCSVWNLAMWPAGSITGTVRSGDRKPMSGVTVQAFAFDSKNNRESSPLRTTTTASDGTYTLDHLPPGSYAIGVNARTYNDEDAYPPTLYSGGTAVYLTESGALGGIDIALPPARAAAQLRVKVFGPDGRPHSGATIKLENVQGVQRWFSRNESDANGEINAPAYIGEHYIVRAFHFVPSADFEGIAQLEVADESPSITIVLGRREITK
jgi:hypothetical protein